MERTSCLATQILGDETHYRNGPPTWEDAPTAGGRVTPSDSRHQQIIQTGILR
jgi:hypothetical protein